MHESTDTYHTPVEEKTIHDTPMARKKIQPDWESDYDAVVVWEMLLVDMASGMAQCGTDYDTEEINTILHASHELTEHIRDRKA